MKSTTCHPPSAIWTAPPWHGEFGWEVMSWAPWCRARARDHGGALITSFADSAALYADFATEFRSHGSMNRTLDYPKSYEMYRSDRGGFEHFRYGDPDRAQPFDILIHARGIRRKAAINYQHWPELAEVLRTQNYHIASIGTLADVHVPGTRDLRNLCLRRLMDLLSAASAASGITVGCSSGTMHLAAACGCDLVVWGDTKTRYGETLERRYKQTWNPHHVRVAWLDADDWQPEPARILRALDQLKTGN